MEETNEIRTAPGKTHTEEDKEADEIKSSRFRLEVLRKRKKELQKIREKLADTIF
jgi:hypothetical protein